MVVAKRQLVAESWGVGGNEVQVMGAPTWMGLAEPMHFAAAIGGVEILESAESVEARARLLQTPDADEDVNDRLCPGTGNRGATHVVNTVENPITDRGGQHCALLLKALRPRGVVWHDPNRLVGHGACAFSRADGVNLVLKRILRQAEKPGPYVDQNFHDEISSA